MKRALLALITLYKRNLSPWLLPACRFQPTCSEYAMEAIENHGPLKGSLWALLRLLRCNPLFKGGSDPVPALCSSKHQEGEH